MSGRCYQCGAKVSRNARDGLKLLCGQRCFGLSRRKNKTKAQKVEEKRIYDVQYRAAHKAMLKAKKAAYFQRTYDPKKAAIERKKTMARHIEYCQRPEYREWKSEYDKKYRAKTDFGPFWEASLLLVDLDKEIDARATWDEIAAAKGTVNKSLQRRREYEKLIGSQS